MGVLAGGRVTHRLTLDGALILDPPHAGDRAKYSGSDAVCAVLASQLRNNSNVGPQAPDTLAAGLARVTVSPHIQSDDSDRQPTTVISGVQSVDAKIPPTPGYHDRLAWTVIVPDVEVSGCGAYPAGKPLPTTHTEAGHHGYAVFVLDARTGRDALRYTERANAPCPGGEPQGPFIGVPLTAVSVPWTLMSEQPDRSSATIAVNVASCDGYAGVAVAVGSEPVRVVVQRPFGPPCGPSRQITEALHADRLGARLPAHLQHAGTGPYVSV